MKKVATILIFSILALPSAQADDWDNNQNFVSIGIADQGWTIDEHQCRQLMDGAL